MNPDGAQILADKLRKLRVVLGVFIAALVVSGVTAFPLLREIEILTGWMGIDRSHPELLGGLERWLLTVKDGLRDTYAKYPWVAYGTDWLAFGHLIIALFFIGPFIDPVRNVWVIQAGLIACFLVIPLALVCGEIRGIPFGWRLIDCSFGVIGAPPLIYCLKIVGGLRRSVASM